jgi:hypothetical protein
MGGDESKSCLLQFRVALKKRSEIRIVTYTEVL